MKVEVNKAGLIALVRSVYPSYEIMEMYKVGQYGYYADQGGWFWNKQIEMLSEDKLHLIYKECKESWE